MTTGRADLTTSTDPVSLLSRALDQAGALVAGTRADQADLPTPCHSWDVAELVTHLVHGLRQFTVRASGASPDWTAPRADVEGDPAEAFRAGADGLVAAWRAAGDLDGTVELPGMGEVPARFPVDQQIAELAVHAWDLAVATGQSTDLDPEVAQTALAWARGTLQPGFRGSEEEGKAFGPEVTVPEDAPVYDRLAAFFGRRVG